MNSQIERKNHCCSLLSKLLTNTGYQRGSIMSWWLITPLWQWRCSIQHHGKFYSPSDNFKFTSQITQQRVLFIWSRPRTCYSGKDWRRLVLSSDGRSTDSGPHSSARGGCRGRGSATAGCRSHGADPSSSQPDINDKYWSMNIEW